MNNNNLTDKDILSIFVFSSSKQECQFCENLQHFSCFYPDVRNNLGQTIWRIRERH